MGCVYVATNKINGKRYVGRTVSTMRRRRYEHERAASQGHPYPLYAAIRKYGEDAFEWRVYSRGDELAELNEVEAFLIKKYGTQRPSCGYNITDGGGGTSGWKPKSETLLKRSRALRGKKRTAEQKKRIATATKSLWADPEYRKKIAVGHSTRPPISEETRAKLRESSKRMWQDPEYRKRYSETRRRLAEERAVGKPSSPPRKSLAGKTFEEIYGDRADEQRAKRATAHAAPEAKAACSAASKKRWADPATLAAARLPYEEKYGPEKAAEIKAKQSAALVGIVRSEEFKEKCRESAKRVPKHIRATGLLKVNAARAANGISDELRQKLRDSHRGKKLTAEQRAKISAGNKGKKRSPETVARMRAAQQARRAAERWAA